MSPPRPHPRVEPVPQRIEGRIILEAEVGPAGELTVEELLAAHPPQGVLAALAQLAHECVQRRVADGGLDELPVVDWDGPDRAGADQPAGRDQRKDVGVSAVGAPVVGPWTLGTGKGKQILGSLRGEDDTDRDPPSPGRAASAAAERLR